MIAIATPVRPLGARSRSAPPPPILADSQPCLGDDGLLERLRAGDHAAFEAVVREHGGRVLAVARRLLRSEEDVADAVQETFLRAFASMHSFHGAAKLSTWLHRIAVNVCLTKLRSRPLQRTVSLDELAPTFDDSRRHGASADSGHAPAASRLEREEIRARVRACIDRLPEDHRTILVLRDLDGLDTDQTAQRLGLSRAAVKTRLHRARQALKQLLCPLLREEGSCC